MGLSTCLSFAALAALAAASTLPSDSSTRSPRRWLRRRTPPLAFQLSEPVFELSPREYADGKPYLIQFKGKGDDYCAQMEPLKEQLREECGISIRCFEVRRAPCLP